MNPRIFELEPEQLQSALLQEGFGRDGEAYARALIAYGEQDLPELEQIYRGILGWGGRELGALVRRRAELLLLRTGHEVAPWAPITKSGEGAAWVSAEADFLEALRLEHEGQFAAARLKYESASASFRSFGAEKKSFKASYNAFVLLHRLESQPDFFQKLQAFFSRAKELGADEIAAASAQALSQDYAILGAGRLSKRYAEEAVGRVKVGTKNYWVALLNSIWVLLMRGDRTEALFELEKCSWIEGESLRKFKESLEAIASGKEVLRTAELVQPFRTRVKLLEEERPDRMPAEQERLVELLAARDLTRDEIIAGVYDAAPADAFAIDRFHHLLQRVRKGGKVGIVQDGVRYRIERHGGKARTGQ